MNSSPNYDLGFAEIYSEWVASIAALTEANRRFYVKRFVDCPGLAVELGVGDGRISIEAAQQGRAMHGVDNSQGMLEQCAARAAERGVERLLELQRADFRDFELATPASLIAIPFHSIGHMLTEQDRLDCMAHIWKRLEPGGRFLFDHFVPDRAYAEAQEGRPLLRSQRVDSATGNGQLLWAINSFDAQLNRLTIRAIQELHDTEGTIHTRRIFSTCLGMFDPDEARRLLLASGFEVEDCFGDFEGTSFDANSKAQVWVARKPSP